MLFARHFRGPVNPRPRVLKEYWLTLNFLVEAHDEQEASEIARDLLAAAQSNVPWKLIGGEVTEIEEV